MKGQYEAWLEEAGLALIAAWAREGRSEGEIAGRMGVAPRTLRRYKQRFEPIAQALGQGESAAGHRVEEALYQKALGGDMRAISFYLKNRLPHRWSDKPAAGGGEQVTIVDDL